jgi:ArsR family transcriptional regulator
MKAPVPDSLLIDAAERFRLLGDPVRLRLLNAMLERDEMSVQALAEATGQSQQNTSKHLRKLAEGGILSCRREGLQALYRVSDPSIPGLCLLVCGQLTAQPQESTAP